MLVCYPIRLRSARSCTPTVRLALETVAIMIEASAPLVLLALDTLSPDATRYSSSRPRAQLVLRGLLEL
jgi:hypothetical protein